MGIMAKTWAEKLVEIAVLKEQVGALRATIAGLLKVVDKLEEAAALERARSDRRGDCSEQGCSAFPRPSSQIRDRTAGQCFADIRDHPSALFDGEHDRSEVVVEQHEIGHALRHVTA